jgi:hypothetical protein
LRPALLTRPVTGPNLAAPAGEMGGGAEAGGQGRAFLGEEVDEGDARAFGCAFLDRGGADAAAAAGDEDVVVREAHGVHQSATDPSA